ncbi:CAP domain-containing protein [Nonomuraea sp. LPB2021202275-12-8]|uniref:CAP domain-containing protein n=1 Tax=Nonomuraea sp. LPB2021202275-12-8 TaxID=3120159 RepID=UPI00300DA953
MRRQLQALACLGSLAALSSIPASPAAARTAKTAVETSKTACRVVAAKPSLDAKGMVRGSAGRSGCDDRALLRVRVKQAVTGPDRTLKSGSRLLTNGRITAKLRCSDTPRRYYVVALDYQGGTSTSRSALLSCKGRPATGGAGASATETEVVRLTNQARAGNGCRPLTHDAKLHTAADRHSADMAAKGYFDHTSRDGRSAGDRIRAAGFAPIRTWGENIAMGQRTAASVVQGWLNSPGHRANIMNCSFTHIGVGQHSKGPHWTQVFAAH